MTGRGSAGCKLAPPRVSLKEIGLHRPLATFRADAAGQYVYVNARWCELTGIRRSDALGDGWQASVYPDDLPSLLAHWKAALAGERLAFAYRCCRRGGGILPVFAQAVAARNSHGAIVGITGTLADLRALRDPAPEGVGSGSRTQQLRAVETRDEIRAVLAKHEDALVSSDLGGHVTFWNQAAERMFGYSAAEMSGSSSLVLTPPECIQQALEWKQRVRAGEPLHGMEAVRVRKDGVRLEVCLTAFPLRDSSQEIVGSWVLLRPQSSRRAGEELVEKLASRLASLQEDERRRFGRELHDSTGQLLTTLTLTLQAMTTSWADLMPEERDALLADSLALAEEAAQELRTQSFLLHPPQLAEQGLGETVRQFVQSFGDRSGMEAGLDIDADLGEISPQIAFIIYRVLQESLSNVHRHSKSSSVYVSLRRKDEALELLVKDYGVGFDPKSICHGLGLVNIKERICQLGGAFSIEPTPKGTTVFAALPTESEA